MVDRQDLLLDVVHRLGVTAELDEDRLVQRVGDDAQHLLAHGGAEEEVLALGRDGVDDALHVRPEAHVEHAVGLVEHQRVDLVEQDVPLAQHVEQAAGRGDQKVDALADLPGLRIVGDAAEDGDDGAAAVRAERLADLFDLPAELAGGSDDEGGRVGRAAVGDGRACHALQDGQDESGRLAGTGLRRAHHVVSCEDARDGLFLDGSRRVVAHGGDAGEQVAGEAELGELGQVDHGSGTGGARGVRALLVALVDALAAATVAARAAAPVAVAAGTVAAGAVPRDGRDARAGPVEAGAQTARLCAARWRARSRARVAPGEAACACWRRGRPARRRRRRGRGAARRRFWPSPLCGCSLRAVVGSLTGFTDFSLPRRPLTAQHVAIRGRA